MKKVLILIALLITPTLAFGLDVISDDFLATRSGQAGVSIIVTSVRIIKSAVTTGYGDPGSTCPEAPVMIDSLTPTLIVKADVDETVSAFQWQIMDEFAPTGPVVCLNVEQPSDITTLVVPALVLDGGKTYSWRVRGLTADGSQLPWTAMCYFSTPAGMAMGIPADLINSDLDANGNGVLDVNEGLSAVYCADLLKSVSLMAANGATIDGVNVIDPATISNQEGMPENLPFGLITYRVGLPVGQDTAEVTIFFSESVPENAVWYKYDPINGWTIFSNAVFSADGKSVTLTLTDGGEGDADYIKNGVIIDPAGVGFKSTDGTNTPAGSQTTAPLSFGAGSDSSGCFITAASYFSR